MSQVNVGVIGCGYWGPNLIRNLVEMPTSRVVVVADLRRERRAHVEAAHRQVITTEDYRDLFSMGLDAVVVATPPRTHYQIAREALSHGLHVLVEKPLTLESQQAEELIDLADSRDLVLMVGHTFEYNPAVRTLKEIIDSGELGQIYYIDAARLNLGLYQRGLSALWDLAPHDVSILIYLLGKDPLSVSAHGTACVFPGIVDVVHAILTFPGGVSAHVNVSWLHPSKTRCVTVVGSKKMVVYDDVSSLDKIKIFDKGVDAPPYTNNFGDFQCSYRSGDVVTPYIQFVEPLRLECSHFIDSITSHSRPLSDGRDGLRVVRVLEAAARSLNNGGREEPILLSEEVQERVVATR